MDNKKIAFISAPHKAPAEHFQEHPYRTFLHIT